MKRYKNLHLTVFLQRMQQCLTMVKNDQEMIRFLILYTLKCWKDNLEHHLIIIY